VLEETKKDQSFHHQNALDNLELGLCYKGF
jgi:hypothetical protein